MSANFCPADTLYFQDVFVDAARNLGQIVFAQTARYGDGQNLEACRRIRNENSRALGLTRKSGDGVDSAFDILQQFTQVGPWFSDEKQPGLTTRAIGVQKADAFDAFECFLDGNQNSPLYIFGSATSIGHLDHD